MARVAKKKAKAPAKRRVAKQAVAKQATAPAVAKAEATLDKLKKDFEAQENILAAARKKATAAKNKAEAFPPEKTCHHC